MESGRAGCEGGRPGPRRPQIYRNHLAASRFKFSDGAGCPDRLGRPHNLSTEMPRFEQTSRMVSLACVRHCLCNYSIPRLPHQGGLRDKFMNKHFFASAVGRWVAPLALAAITFCGTLGFSSVASAQERAYNGVAASHVTGGEHRERFERRGWDERERGGHGHRHGGEHRGGHHDGRRH
jgi:hypothetical protein